MMKNRLSLLLALVSWALLAAAQNPAPTAPRTDVYHVHLAKAALGKGAEEGDFLKQPDLKAPMPGHFIVLRHQSGEDWDYAVIEHLGTKATVDAAGAPAPAGARDLNAWHGDTFVNGPAWPVFSKAMGLDDAAKSAGSVYIVSVFRAAPGHRDELEKSLAQPPGPADTVAGNVLMQHLEGGPWQFLTITRYNSWQDFATSEKASVAETLKPDGGWLGVRNHSTYHNDTITDRIAP
jgi:heme-degrading monooxygenase HmoA